PTVVGETIIDGTTQPGGWVEVTGSGESTLTLGDGTSTVRGLALGGARHAIQVSAGTGHVVEGNRLGVSRTESATGDTELGLVLLGGDVQAVRDNVISATEVGIANYSEGTIGVISGNRIGVSSTGGALGTVQRGVELLASGPSEISGNTIRSTQFGVIV